MFVSFYRRRVCVCRSREQNRQICAQGMEGVSNRREYQLTLLACVCVCVCVCVSACISISLGCDTPTMCASLSCSLASPTCPHVICIGHDSPTIHPTMVKHESFWAWCISTNLGGVGDACIFCKVFACSVEFIRLQMPAGQLACGMLIMVTVEQCTLFYNFHWPRIVIVS